MIHIGFHTVPMVPAQTTVLNIQGRMVFRGNAYIGRGSRIFVKRNGLLELGNNFAISASSYINCYKHVKMGDDILLSWGVLIMDSDSHMIYGLDGTIINDDKEIVLGNKVWVGCDCKILKGSYIPDNCVVGANSFVTSSSQLEPNTIITGCPAVSVKQIKGFKI